MRSAWAVDDESCMVGAIPCNGRLPRGQSYRSKSNLGRALYACADAT